MFFDFALYHAWLIPLLPALAFLVIGLGTRQNKKTSAIIGITAIEGHFDKGEIVKIVAPDGRELGVGKAAYDSEKAQSLIGKKGLRPMVHYDYLYLD